MATPRRYPLLLLSLLMTGAGFWTTNLAAQGYPSKPIRIIVGFVPGGSADISARLIVPRLSELLGQQIIVENRPGTGGLLALERVATSPPDGYSLVMVTASAPILSVLHTKLSYDLERDFSPISLVTMIPNLLVVHPSLPARNVKELIALARAQPGKLNYGSSGNGSAPHLAAELFNSMAKINIVHVPYKGAPEYVTATVTGEIQLSYASVASSLPMVKSGRLRALGVTGLKRTSLVPELPTIIESGLPGYIYPNWNGVSAPAGVSREIVGRLHGAISKAVNEPNIRESFVRNGLEAETNTPEEFTAFIRREIAQNAKVIKTIGLKPE